MDRMDRVMGWTGMNRIMRWTRVDWSNGMNGVTWVTGTNGMMVSIIVIEFRISWESDGISD